MDTPPPQPVSLIGASIPRSGHHFLVRILRRALGKDLHYCGFYKVEGCCRQIPCIRTEGRQVVFQKSHDWDFGLPTGLAGVTYVVQHRHPVPQAFSDIDLHLADTTRKGRQNHVSTRPELEGWLARKAFYYKRFHDKWTAQKQDNVVFVPYDELSADPAGTVSEMLRRSGATVPTPRRMERAIEGVRDQRGRQQTYKPRVVQDSPYFDEDLFSAYESMLLDLCPRFGYQPILRQVNYRRHSIYRRYLWNSLKVRLRDRVRALRGQPPAHF